jgi:hypothetical protein
MSFAGVMQAGGLESVEVSVVEPRCRRCRAVWSAADECVSI